MTFHLVVKMDHSVVSLDSFEFNYFNHYKSQETKIIL